MEAMKRQVVEGGKLLRSPTADEGKLIDEIRKLLRLDYENEELKEAFYYANLRVPPSYEAEDAEEMIITLQAAGLISMEFCYFALGEDGSEVIIG